MQACINCIAGRASCVVTNRMEKYVFVDTATIRLEDFADKESNSKTEQGPKQSAYLSDKHREKHPSSLVSCQSFPKQELGRK